MLSDDDALRLADAAGAELEGLLHAARGVRDERSGAVVTYSPKLFLPVTNLCRDRCGYCAFRRSPGEPGAWTMTPAEIESQLARGVAEGCAEALLCLGDRPETAFAEYRRTLAEFGHATTVDYLERVARAALARGLLPHTNAGILTKDEMARLQPVNVSLGLMLEHATPRLAAHRRAPDKHPDRRVAMIEDAGRLGIPFTSGVLVGIGETARERVESLLALRRVHGSHGHLQEVIVQPFRAHAGTPMARAPEPSDDELARTVALARLVLPPEVSVQSPPNLARGDAALLLHAGLDDFGGISPVTPDYINPRHAWPHVEALSRACARQGFTLRARLAVHDRFADRVHPALIPAARAARARLDAARAA